jgi:hypothetical protein
MADRMTDIPRRQFAIALGTTAAWDRADARHQRAAGLLAVADEVIE